jgi:hypothetical protein
VADDLPLWRRAYDELDKGLTPHIEALVRSDTFLREMARLGAARAGVKRQVAGLTGRVWHLVNLPAGSDLARLTGQVGALDRQVRNLMLQLEQQRRPHAAEPPEDDDGAQPEPDGSAQPGPARRRTQRPARP